MLAGHGARRSLAPLTLLLASTVVSEACAGASASVAPSATAAPIATPTAIPGSTAIFAAELKADQKTQLKADPESETPTTLGGVPAVRLTYAITSENGQPITFVDDVVSRAGTGWEVYLVVDAGPEAIDTFDTFVATFAFTG
jgi:hypothetical protein